MAPASTGRHRTGNVVRRVNLRTGLLTTPAGGGLWGLGGDGGLARQAQLALLEGVSVDRSGNLLATDGSSVRVVAAASGAFYGQVMKAGDIYTGAGGGTSLRNGVLAASALLKHPHAVTVDGAGNIVVGDQLATRLRVVAARTGTFYGVPMRAGHVYMIAGNRRTWSSGAAEPATRAQFFPNWPITFDNGNLVAADSHSTSTSLHTSVRLVPARSGSFFGIAMKAGHLYRIAGNGQLDFSGNGTPARRSGIGQISALAADLHGNLVIGDRDNFRILVVAARTGTFYGRAMTTGRIYSIAGNGDYHYSGHGGPAVKAGIEPGPVRVDQHGNVITGQSPRNPGRRQSHRHLLRRRHDRGRHLHPSPATATTTTPATAARPWTPSSRGSAASRETAPTGCWSRTCTGYG